MADENTGTGAGASQQPDPIANVKGEFNRKIGNLEQQIGTLVETNKQLAAQVQRMSAPAPTQAAPAADDDAEIEKQWFDNPTKAASLLTQKVTKQVTQQVNDNLAANQRTATTVNQLVEEFPELRKGDHPLTKRAVEIYEGFSPEDKKNPISYKAAVSQAALEMQVAPKSKRQEDDEHESSDDFSLSGEGSSSVRQEQRRSRSADRIDPATVEFAKLMGVNIDDTKVKERIKNRHGRKNYNRYE